MVKANIDKDINDIKHTEMLINALMLVPIVLQTFWFITYLITKAQLSLIMFWFFTVFCIVVQANYLNLNIKSSINNFKFLDGIKGLLNDIEKRSDEIKQSNKRHTKEKANKKV